jgi:cytochrome c biogenesis protein CcdA
VLGALLTYASARATLAGGMALLGSYALGLAVPFLLAALRPAPSCGLAADARRSRSSRRSSGVVLVAGRGCCW